MSSLIDKVEEKLANAPDDEDSADIINEMVRNNAHQKKELKLMKIKNEIFHLADPDVYQSANYLFTWNNPPKNDDGEYKTPIEWLVQESNPTAPKVKFIACQLECGEQGTVHWQGYVGFARKQTIVGLKTKVHKSWWWGRTPRIS